MSLTRQNSMQTNKFKDGQCPDRAAFIAAQLDARNVPMYGRSARLRELTGVSPQVAQSILKGSLPKSARVLLDVCKTLGFSLEQWVTGAEAEVQLSEIATAVEVVKRFENDSAYELTPVDFAGLVQKVLDDPVYAERFTGDIINMQSFQRNRGTDADTEGHDTCG